MACGKLTKPHTPAYRDQSYGVGVGLARSRGNDAGFI